MSDEEIREFQIDITRLKYELDLLMVAVEAMREAALSRKTNFHAGFVLKEFAESGGPAGEALTRLMGEGVLQEFPEIKPLEIAEGEDLPLSQVSVVRTENEKTRIEAKLYFFAALPDEAGRETQNDAGSYQTACEAKINFVIDDDCQKLVERLERDKSLAVERLAAALGA